MHRPTLPLWSRMAIIALSWVVVCWSAPSALAQTSAGQEDPAWRLYDRAFELLAKDDKPGARALLDQLRSQFPDHPAATQAALRVTELIDAGSEPPAVDNPRHVSKFARGELSLLLTIHGVYLGQNICRLADCSGTRSNATSVMLGGALGLGGALLGTRRGISQGHAQLLESAPIWGIWNTMLIHDDTPFEDHTELTSLLLQAGGFAAGLGLAQVWRPSSGQIAMANTGFTWAQVLYLFAAGAVGDAFSLRYMAAMGDIGIITGAALGKVMEDDMSRGRTLVIDAGGILGALTGGLVAVISQADTNAGVFTPLLLGTASGLFVAGYATRNWRASGSDKASPARLTVMPMGQRGWGAGVSVVWP